MSVYPVVYGCVGVVAAILDYLTREFPVSMMPVFEHKLSRPLKLLWWSSCHLLGVELCWMTVEEMLEWRKSWNVEIHDIANI